MYMGGMLHGANPDAVFDQACNKVCDQGCLAAASMADNMKRGHGVSLKLQNLKNTSFILLVLP